MKVIVIAFFKGLGWNTFVVAFGSSPIVANERTNEKTTWIKIALKKYCIGMSCVR